MSKIILFSIVSIVVIILFIQFRKQKIVKIPVDKLNVESLAIALDDDLEAEVSIDTEKAIAEAIISDLETEAVEALPETLTPSIENIDLSEEDSEELESLLSGDLVSLGRMLGMSSVKKRTGEKTNGEKREESLEVIKKNIVKDETNKLIEQVQFLDAQIENVEKERSEKKQKVSKKIKEIESVDLKKAKEERNPVKIEDLKERIERLKKNVEVEDMELKKKSEKLVKLSNDKKEKSSDKNKLNDKLENVKHPRKSKKGKVKSLKIPNDDGSVSFILGVPSDINPEEVDEIEIDISEEVSETLEEFEEIKERITKDKSLDNISEEDKEVIKSAGKEFKKIKKSYIEKRSEKIRKRTAKNIKV